MERITGNEVKSMMEAYASVYKTEDQEVISEEVEVLDEVRTLRPGESIKQYDERKAKAQQSADAKRRGVEDRIYRDGGGDAKVKEFQDKGYTLGQARRATMNQGRTNQRNAKPSSSQSTTSGMTPAQVKAAQDAANKARRDGKIGGLPADYKKTELEAGKTAERYRTGAGLPQSGGGNQGNYGKGATTTKPTTAQSPTSNLKPGSPNTVVSPKSGEKTKFERRLPTMAELRAAQAARKAAAAGGASKQEAGYQAVKAGVGVSKGTVKDPKIAADAARKAELERIRSRAASQTKAGVRPTVASTADPKTPPSAAAKSAPKPAGGKEDIFTSTPPGGKPYGNATKPATRVPTGGAVKTGNVNLPTAKPATRVPTSSIAGRIEKAADTYVKPNVERIGAQIGRDRASKMPGGNIPIVGDIIKNKGEQMGRDKAGKLYNKTKTQVKSGDVGGLLKTASEVGRELTQSADLFDIVKGHLMSEGLTEEEALKQMLQLTDEQRTEIIEGSYGSKKKKKSKKGGY